MLSKFLIIIFVFFLTLSQNRNIPNLNLQVFRLNENMLKDIYLILYFELLKKLVGFWLFEIGQNISEIMLKFKTYTAAI